MAHRAVIAVSMPNIRKKFALTSFLIHLMFMQTANGCRTATPSVMLTDWYLYELESAIMSS